MTRTFKDKLRDVQSGRPSFALYISPKIDRMPPEFQRHDDPFLPYMRSVYAATVDLVCAYMFNFGSYLTLGAAGAIALERSIALATETHLTVLDGQFASADYAHVWDETAFGCDAVTIAPNVPLSAFQERLDRQAFVVSSAETDTTRYDVAKKMIVLGQEAIQILPFDLADRARSLTFEETLRNAVREHVSA